MAMCVCSKKTLNHKERLIRKSDKKRKKRKLNETNWKQRNHLYLLTRVSKKETNEKSAEDNQKTITVHVK